MIKNILGLVFSIIVVATSFASEPIQVLSSASMFADMAATIGGDKVEVGSIVPIGGDPHLYDPSPSDVQNVLNADIILVNGLTFEGWIAKLIKNSGTKATVKTITEGVEAIGSTDYENAFDPHAWMAADNGLIYIANILEVLQSVAPEHAEYFQKNYDKYKLEIEATDAYIEEKISQISEAQRVLITSHDAFAYFGKRYGMKLNAIKGISTEEQTQTSDVMRVIDVIKRSKVPAIFIESTINPKMMQQIAKDTGVKVGGELYADSLGPKGSQGDTYIKMLRHNTDVIHGALSQELNTVTKIDADTKGISAGVYILLALVMLGMLGFLVSKFK